ncbi:hypothetical protein QFC22_002737 [Naganishia vaughanmartiniae]|uniref:Uncharacterized protein n=1 Tax=Naganishia vaughanmartiniae TaxID=1424756 RepID=A0ACC2X9W3_9TREE|nr:hypothetical protein QFC22_002737 [Naganishia vaughanmartiniae]
MTPSRRGSSLSLILQRNDPLSPAAESEMFLDVARLTSRQVEKDRALDRAQDAKNKCLATESIGNQRVRAEATQRSRARSFVPMANAVTGTAKPPAESELVSAMASFGISYESGRRPSMDTSLDPLAKEESKEQRHAAHQRRKRMRRKLEHERVIRETPVGEYSNPFDTYLGGKQRDTQDVDHDQMSQLTESICEEDEDEDPRSATTASFFRSTTADMASGEG